MAERTDHALEARRVLDDGRASARKAKAAAQSGQHREADAHGSKAHGCWMQAQAEATLALVEQQRIANRLKVAELDLIDELGGFASNWRIRPYLDAGDWESIEVIEEEAIDGD